VPETTKTGLMFLRISPGTPFVAMAEIAQNSNPVLVSPLTGIHYFQPQNPNFDPLDPKLVPKVYLYIYKHKKSIKTI